MEGSAGGLAGRSFGWPNTWRPRAPLEGTAGGLAADRSAGRTPGAQAEGYGVVEAGTSGAVDSATGDSLGAGLGQAGVSVCGESGTSTLVNGAPLVMTGTPAADVHCRPRSMMVPPTM